MNLTIGDLRQEFDIVKLHYTTVENKKVTRAALVKGNAVFLGFAECDPRDQFCKPKGRQMALGRAYYQAQVYLEKKAMRKSSRLAYVRIADPRVPITIDDILKAEVFT